jgi:hypothetical protein
MGELKLLGERNETSEEAWSGESVVVVGGKASTVDACWVTVTVTVVTADPGEVMVGKGSVLLPRDVQLLPAMPPWAPEPSMIEAALFWLVHATNYLRSKAQSSAG